ncbi:reverse transcriptase domain-containing protein [Tanacetum coccineum]|uniref:Reverse transcriptase domain-containing protein n=1 Tax=Tanacetum coccineum TaxID=301880 RepID=A0ABQ5FIK0_9ASTR
MPYPSRRYDVSMPTLHEGFKSNTPYPGTSIRRIQDLLYTKLLEDNKRGPYSKKAQYAVSHIGGYDISNRLSDPIYRRLVTDIKKGQKSSQNGQNRARNRKSMKKSKSTKSKINPSLALKARQVLSDDDTSSSDSNDEEYAMAEDKKEERRCFKCGDPNHFISDCPKNFSGDQKAFVVGSWSDSGDDSKKEEICLMAHSNECMQTRSSSKFVGEPSTNPTSTNSRRLNRSRSKQRVEPFALEEVPIVTMADQRTMVQLLRAPTEGYVEAIVVPPILVELFELKHSLINMMTSDQFFGLEKDNPHYHIRWFNKITSTIKYKDVPNLAIKLMLFPFSLGGAARCWLKKEPPRSILTWEDLVSKFINEFFPPSRTTNLQNEISNFQQRFDE